jgi:uncharacterized protein YbbC (DUF1343 family)/CubicO group peptidase (beta-lactamase class C family)
MPTPRRWARIVLGLALIAWTLRPGAASAGAASPAPEWTAAVDTAVRDAIAAGHLPGAVVLVGQGDRILYRKALGLRAVTPRDEPMTVDTIFDLASLTKVLATTPAILALADDGRLDLDAPVTRYLRELPASTYREVTLRRLLLHSAGVPNPPDPRSRSESIAGLLPVIVRAGLDFTPGTGFTYSDTGFILLGEVVRRVSGRPLDQFARLRFYEPLGMTRTGFNPPLTWRSRVAPTQFGRGGHLLRGEVHDGHARALGGVAGHAGLFGTADDVARFCRMVLDGGVFARRRYLAADTVRAMLTPEVVGEATRGLGWDMASPYAWTLGSFFPMGSVGHTGYTGTAIWMDPPSRTYLILLTNRVHPYGQGQIAGLRRRVAAAVGAALFGGGEPPPTPAPAPGGEDPDAAPAAAGLLPTLASDGSEGRLPDPQAPEPTLVGTGLDRLVDERFATLAGRRVGLLTNQTGVNARGRRGVDLLASAPGVQLRALFSPEHGLGGKLDEPVPNGKDEATGLPVWSLYGPTRRPSPAMLAGIDTLVVDLQDVGVRYYTYLTTLVYVLETAARLGLRVVVLDRPDPITGTYVEGPLMDPDLRSFTAPHTIPVRSGLTTGEFARLVAGERGIPVELTVVALKGWRRTRWFDQLGLPWVNPSPNIRSPRQALLYAGVGLLESTNLSVGRGTDSPFELVGAAWIDDPGGVADRANALGLPGIRFEPVRFTPASSEYAGQTIGGIRLVVTDRDLLRPVRMALGLAQVLRERYPGEFRPAAIQDLLVNREAMWTFLRRDPVDRLWRWLDADEATFRARREPYLLYK